MRLDIGKGYCELNERVFRKIRINSHYVLMKDFSLLEKKLGLEFRNKDFLVQAFVHRSYSNENPNFKISNNERLEFLGDAILEKVVTVYLYLKYPDKPEGVLTSWRSALVNAKMLSKVASQLGFNNFLLLSQGEEKETGKARQYILADALEAFIGALYLDQGIKTCQRLIKENILKNLPDIVKNGFFKDAKSRLQEEAQERAGITPDYKVIKEWGPDHAKHFTVGVYFGKKVIAKGEGSSKHEAEEAAAEEALKVKGW